MARQVDTAEYLDTLCALLEQGAQEVCLPVAGSSMCPFLYPGDKVVLTLPGERRRPGDIFLFQRPAGSYVLHRLLRVEKGGALWFLGDNQRQPEPVSPSAVRARVVAVTRKGRALTPKSPVWWLCAYPWRWLWRCRSGISAALRRLRR